MKSACSVIRFIILCFILFLLPILFKAKAITPLDSLKALLAYTKEPQKRINICIKLNNYCESMNRKEYLSSTYLLLNEGVKAHDEYAITIALRGLIMSIDRHERNLSNDSIIHYLEIAEKNLKGEMKESFITEVHLRHIRSIVDWANDEDKVISDLMKQYTTPKECGNNIYYQIEREYALGMSSSLMISDAGKNLAIESESYFDNLLSLLSKLPVEFGANLLFCVSDNLFVTYFNIGNKVKAVKMLEVLMSVLAQYQELLKQKDIYQNFDDIYSLYYEGLARSPEIIGKEKAKDYMMKFDEISRRPNGLILSLFYAYEDYYKSLGDYHKAIIYGDSIILALKDSAFNETPAVCSSIYKDQAQYYAQLKDYKNAYERFLLYDKINDSIINVEPKKLRQEMAIRYNVNNLELERTKLLSHNRQIALMSVLLILLISIVWGISQRINIKKLQRVQKKLIESNKEVLRQSIKAEESENMKVAFINSMCHEIRTPLNAITGFTSLLLDESIDNEMKEEFPELIKQNSDQLTQLLNDLLEVSNLNSSCAEFPVERADIYVICKQELEKLISFKKKPNIVYQLDIEEKSCAIFTHITYFTRVINNLLNNANKFTDEGSIILTCHKEGKQLVISVSDTGIGIPADKREWVFERFTKMDEFMPGTGLGLYVCRLIMKRLGGTIKIDSEYTEGTKVILTLPL